MWQPSAWSTIHCLEHTSYTSSFTYMPILSIPCAAISRYFQAVQAQLWNVNPKKADTVTVAVCKGGFKRSRYRSLIEISHVSQLSEFCGGREAGKHCAATLDRSLQLPGNLGNKRKIAKVTKWQSDNESDLWNSWRHTGAALQLFEVQRFQRSFELLRSFEFHWFSMVFGRAKEPKLVPWIFPWLWAI